ncbi:alpha/beta hydrolase [Actinomadura hibisca]|uniref:alpha/beta hydrolase n=1 Tax=Actinomadura hibisca TaxID=68565 RepID=UPI00082BDE69|nr:alpha/beta hydrolase [Actinomadura hibisca]
MLRTAPLLAVAALAAVGAAVPASAAPAAPARADALARFHHQPVHWKNCTLGPGDEIGESLDKAGAKCADITVPLDYARPGGRTITVAISRLAADKGRRIGTMLLNGGGPGPALDMPPYMRGVMKEAGPRFDLVAMDPRSLGRSTPVDCGWPTGSWIRSAGLSRASFERSAALARDLADRCRRKHADLLPHISTRNVARDMDVVRAALGERRISYNGASYGNYLGGVYATLFPSRLDRVVLDSGIDPATWGGPILKGVAGVNEQALGRWAEWTARRDATYGLGTTRAAVLGATMEVIKVSGRSPLRVGPYRVDDTVTPVLLFSMIQSDRDAPRADLTAAVAELLKAARGRPAQATGALGENLGFLLTGEEAAYGSGQSALICGDGAAPADPEFYWRDIRRTRRSAPFFGALAHNLNPCAFWPVKPREKPTEIGANVPALLVGATGDTRTPYSGTRVLTGLLKGSRLVTLRGADVHAPYQADYGNACVSDVVNRYQVTGRLPARNVVCD